MHIGQVLRSRYKIIRVLGSGGFGDTYLAEDIDLPNNPKCVVKHLKYNPNPGVLEIAKRLFESEAQVLYKLGNESDQIPKLFAHFEDNGEFYLVQDFIEGKDLSKEIFPGKKWSEIEVIDLLEAILEVFTFIHNRNIIHRDIKPANLIRRKQDGKIVVIDFGAVKEIGTLMMTAEGETVPSVAIGTPGYMPSEQAIGQPKLSSDIHAIGMLGVYALTGIKPRELQKDHSNGETIWRELTNISDRTADILTKMVKYHFNDRYHSAFDTIDDIRAIKAQSGVHSELNSELNHESGLPTLEQVRPQYKVQMNLKRRREVLKTLGLVGTGFGLAMLGGYFYQLSASSLKTFNFQTITVNATGEKTNDKTLNAKYLAEELGNDITLEMVQIAGGKFIMGSPNDEKERDDDEDPQHEVTVPEFFMGRYPVTQAQYEAVMGKNPSHFKDKDRPVEKVSWNDAVEFCNKLNNKTGRNYRLPSEAEWEYACRAGTTTPFYFGETITPTLVNYNGEFTYASAPKGENRKETTKVGEFPANAFGLYDMHGNMWEWCQDTWHNNYQGAPTDGSPWIGNNDLRVQRGGDWKSNPGFCRSANRGGGKSKDSSERIGFRVVVILT